MANKKEMVYDQIRAQIIDCTLPPGMPINEASFAERFGVSKTPIREAIRQLEREDLVSSIPGRGSIIAYISSGDIFEIFEVREILECGAARLAAALPNKEILLEKQKELLDLQEKLNGDEEDSKDWDCCNDIHQIIIDSIANKKLSRMYREVLDSIKRIRNNYEKRFSGRRVKNILEEHLAIIDAIISGHGDEAQEKVREHLHNATSYLRSLN